MTRFFALPRKALALLAVTALACSTAVAASSSDFRPAARWTSMPAC